MTPEPTKLTYFVLYDEGDDVYYSTTMPMYGEEIGGQIQYIVCTRFPFEATKYLGLKEALTAKKYLQWSAESEQADLADRLTVREMTITYDLGETEFFDVLNNDDDD